MLIKNAKGMTLVEIMVAIGLLGGLAVASMQLFQNQSKQQKTVEANYDIAAIVQEMRAVLSSTANCTESLNGAFPNGASITTLRKEVPSGSSTFVDFYPVGEKFPGNISILSYTTFRANTNIGDTETYLKVEFSRGKATIKESTPRMIKIVFTPQITGALDEPIDTCSAISADGENDTFWLQDVAFAPSIYYPLGNVGIGPSADPLFKLDIDNEANAGPAVRIQGSHLTGASMRFQNTTPGGMPWGGHTWDLGPFAHSAYFGLRDISMGTTPFMIRENGAMGVLTGGYPAATMLQIGSLTTPEPGYWPAQIELQAHGTSSIHLKSDPTNSYYSGVHITSTQGNSSFHQYGPSGNSGAWITHTPLADGVTFNSKTLLGVENSSGSAKAYNAPAGVTTFVAQGSTTDSTAAALNVTNSAGVSTLFARNDGYVGIGTNAPTAKLTIWGTNGDDNQQKIRIGAGAGLDYEIFRENQSNEPPDGRNHWGNLRFQANQPDFNGYTFHGEDLYFISDAPADASLEGKFVVDTIQTANIASIWGRDAGVIFQNSQTGGTSNEGYINLYSWSKDVGTTTALGFRTNNGVNGASLFLNNTGYHGINTDPGIDAGMDSALTIRDHFNSVANLRRIRIGGTGNNSYTLGRNPATGVFEFIGYQAGLESYSFNGNVTAPAFIYSSDERLKKNIKTINKSSEIIEKLRGVMFNWKKDGKTDYGFVAQEVEEVLPELVTSGGSDGMKGVKYGNISAILVESQKELIEENRQLKREISVLKRLVCKDHPEDEYCR